MPTIVSTWVCEITVSVRCSLLIGIFVPSIDCGSGVVVKVGNGMLVLVFVTVEGRFVGEGKTTSVKVVVGLGVSVKDCGGVADETGI